MINIGTADALRQSILYEEGVNIEQVGRCVLSGLFFAHRVQLAVQLDKEGRNG